MCLPLKISNNSHLLQKFRCPWLRELTRPNLLANNNSRSHNNEISMGISLKCYWIRRRITTIEKLLTLRWCRILSKFKILSMMVIIKLTILLLRFSISRPISRITTNLREPTVDWEPNFQRQIRMKRPRRGRPC